MVIGLFPSPDHAAVCLSNLAEADFRPSNLSVIMKTTAASRALAEATGRLSGVSLDQLPNTLIGLGVPPESAAAYRDEVQRGGVFLAVDAVGADDVAKEMLEDHGAQSIRMVRDR
jgi:hypothetical protein